MADTLTLGALTRTKTGKGAARAFRRENLVPGIIYGANKDTQPITVKFNEILKLLKAGKFMSTLIDLSLGEKTEQVICRAVQKDVVKDLPTHIDFLRLSKNSRINLFIPVAFQNQDVCPGLKRGGVLTVVRQDVELVVNATDIPSELIVDLSEFELGDTITISNIKLPEGAKPTIMGRDFVIANIQAPSGLRSTDNESEGDDTEDSDEETTTQE
jgi:large subunit ribosomal protein L25